MQGKFVVIDGIDGVGKGIFLSTLVEEAKKQGLRIFDVHEFWEKNNFHPDPKDLISNYDVIITSEPTFIGIGNVIRTELIAKNRRNYSPEAVAEAYALDRMILYSQLLLPLLKAGLHVFQSRSFSTSIVYQRQSALDEGREFSMQEIMSIPGNVFCAKYPFNFLLIPTIKDVKESLRRAEQRDKDDNCKFENLDFQLKIKKHYESEEFQTLFKNLGTKLIYMDAGKTIDYSKQQAREFYQENF